MDMNQYLGIFVDEAREHLQNLNDKLMELEDQPRDPELISSIFRSAHTLKGSSGQMGFGNMMKLTHTMENVFDALRHQKITVSSDMIDRLFEALDTLESMVDSVEQGESDEQDINGVLAKLQDLVQADPAPVSAGNGRQDHMDQSAGHSLPKINFSDYDKTVITQAKDQNMQTFVIEITLRNDCVLKAARALMVSNALEEAGHIIKSEPSTEDIEKEAFDRQFTYVYVSNMSAESIHKKVMNISEIERADIVPVSDRSLESESGEEKADQSAKPAQAKKRASNNRVQGYRQVKPVAKTIRVNLERLDHLLNLFEEMVIDRSRLERIAASMNDPELQESVRTIKTVSDQMQETILNLRMEPVEQVFNRFPRMVRSLAKELNKKVHLVISGSETELDRTMIDELGDPLMHMIRNSMDHGIEHPDERAGKGKNPEGTLSLRAYHSGNHVFIEIEDDGAGINREQVLKKALQKKLISEEVQASMTDKDVYHLLFESGFSTSEKISDISGRGVGLDVVESKIQSMSGSVQVESTEGAGTKFTVRLPLTLSIISAMLVQCGSEVYAIPMTSIKETALSRLVKLQTIRNTQVMSYQNHVMPVIDLSSYLDIPDPPEMRQNSSGSIIVVHHGKKMAGLAVEKILGYQDIVIKPLGKYLENVKGFSGATILGDGKVSLILDCQVIIEGQQKQTKCLRRVD
ncbi:chemotaxis protein CheA [Sporolactobacillus sp. THM19-2]|uniref:chemotaxis protein CheA n=1 Tax=Sporolactobacillus sp. THM19-2 TaxID=2511171 RepID=UPI001020F5E6|nr:chemotaxis protein CheA [Sporolactobacillus sp. THM19-2]RYL92969.1 chemotaxis protein CheA [Sporolactobacillus sp. THM19-2]